MHIHLVHHVLYLREFLFMEWWRAETGKESKGIASRITSYISRNAIEIFQHFG